MGALNVRARGTSLIRTIGGAVLVVVVGLLAYGVLDGVSFERERPFGHVSGSGHGIGNGWNTTDDLVRLIEAHEVTTLQVWDDGRVQATLTNGMDQLMGLDRGVLETLEARGVDLGSIRVKRR
jgi:hypothetical protein